MSLLHSVLLAAAVAAPAAPTSSACHTASVGWVPREVLSRPVPMRDGIGTLHDPVTTSSKEAQAFYDQGLAYLHGYVWIEAARSFHQALRHDANLAMAHVGLSRAFSGLEDKPAARAAWETARALGARATAREQRRIAARGKQLDAMEDLDPKKHDAYRAALDAALLEDPKDLELLRLRGNAEEPLPGGRGQMGGPYSIEWYGRALALQPEDFAAHHFLIHSYENTGAIPAALKHGEAYARLAPAVPHAHHMYGHDLRRVGRTAEAIERFERALAQEEAYYAKEKIPRDLDWHHGHNLNLLAASYQHQGRMKKAETLFRQSFALAQFSEFHAFQGRELPSFLLARGRPKEALVEAEKLAQSKFAAGRYMGHVLAGEALLALGRRGEVRARLALAEAEVPKISGDYAGMLKSYLPVYGQGLEGNLLAAEGKKDEAAERFQVFVGALRANPSPDAWSDALFQIERIASLARAAGDWPLAERMAREMLDHDAAYAGAHLALARVNEHAGDVEAAKKSMADARKLWSAADPGLLDGASGRKKTAK